MKKFARLLLAALLAAVWTGGSLAEVSADYREGKLYVTTDEKGFWEIFIDNEWVGYWVGDRQPTAAIPTELGEGEYTVTIYNSDENRYEYAKVQVTESQPDAAPEAQGSVKLENVRYAKGVLTFQVSGLRGLAEIWLDGAPLGVNIKEDGEKSLLRLLSAGEHSLTVYLPAQDELDSQPVTAESFLPDAEAVRPALETLVENEAGEPIPCGLAIDRDEAGFLLRVSVDNKPGAVLAVGGGQLQTLLDQGLNVIEYRTGKAALRIDLTQITDPWFDTAAPVTACTFALAAREDGVQVTVSALTADGTVEAGALTGVALIRGDERVDVPRSGVY